MNPGPSPTQGPRSEAHTQRPTLVPLHLPHTHVRLHRTPRGTSPGQHGWLSLGANLTMTVDLALHIGHSRRPENSFGAGRDVLAQRVLPAFACGWKVVRGSSSRGGGLGRDRARFVLLPLAPPCCGQQ